MPNVLVPNYSVIQNYFTSPCGALLPLVVVLFLSAGCKRDFGGTRLFEVTYAPQNLSVPAGQVSPISWVVDIDPLPTGFAQALADNGVPAEDVDLVGGFRARVTTLDGTDFSEIDRIELRACPRGQQFGCDRFQNVFTWTEAGGGRRQTLNLNPTPINFRELFVGNEEFRFEITFRPRISTTQSIAYRLEWSVQAVGDLD